MTDKSTGQIALFCTDLDGTLLGNPEAAARFTRAWKCLPEQPRPLLVYNTGRSLLNVQALIESGFLPVSDVIIGSLGTELHDRLDLAAEGDFRRLFGEGWSISAVERIVQQTPGIVRQGRDAIHPFQSSWICDRVSDGQRRDLAEKLRLEGLKAELVYTGDRYLDVIPAGTNKGSALQWLCIRKKIVTDRVLVAGDSANDASMFLIPDVRRIVVENAQPQLFASLVKAPKFVSAKCYADGVLDGLRHFGLSWSLTGTAGSQSAKIDDFNVSAQLAMSQEKAHGTADFSETPAPRARVAGSSAP